MRQEEHLAPMRTAYSFQSETTKDFDGRMDLIEIRLRMWNRKRHLGQGRVM